MPLYNNVRLYDDSDKNTKDDQKSQGDRLAPVANKPSSSLKFLQDHLLSKKRTKQLSVKKSTSQKPFEFKSSNPEQTLPIKRFCGEPCDWDPQDEYDPMAPNSYEIFQADYLKAEEQKLLAKQSRPSAPSKIDTSLLDALDHLDNIDDELETRMTRGIAIAPPPILQSTSCSSSHYSAKIDEEISDVIDDSSIATQMMFEKGCKVGLDLSRDDQVINAPLKVDLDESTHTNCILDPSKFDQSLPAVPNDLDTDKSTRVLLLQNMVGPGEVDDDLEAETKEECTKYGEVIKCLIYEIPNKIVPDDQAVRIFVEFGDCKASTKAYNDLNGRYFGGRTVKATFYNVDNFKKYDLGL